MKRAFTLIELLVVIAIIAILAAILFPVFAQAKDSAKNTALLSQTKQLALGNIMYATDYNDLFPPTMASSQEYWIDDAWQILIQPYVRNIDMIRNPKREQFNTGYLTKAEHFGMPPRAVIAYAASARNQGYFSGTHDSQAIRWDGIGGFVNLNDDWGPGADWLGRWHAPSLSTTAVVDVAKTMMIGEANWWDMGFSILPVDTTDPYGWCMGNDATTVGDGWAITGSTCTTRPDSYGNSGVAGLCWWQGGRTTIAACDGHARSISWRQNLYAPYPANNTTAYSVVKWLNPLGW